MNGHLGVVKFLLFAGADLTVKNKNNKMATDVAANVDVINLFSSWSGEDEI